MTTAGALPDAIRLRVLALAAERLGSMPEAETPAALRRIRAFTPAKRARLAAAPLTTALEHDRAFRAAVAEGVLAAHPQVAAALTAGTPPTDADPEGVAAIAWLLRSPGWEALAEAAAERAAAAEAAARGQDEDRATARLEAEALALRAAATAREATHAAEISALQASVAEARRRSKPVEAAARRAEALAQQRISDADAAAAARADELAAATTQVGRLRARVAELEGALEAARRAARGERATDDARIRMLLDTVLSAGQGLRRALALGVQEAESPADAVLAGLGVSAVPITAVVTDPAALDALLALPSVHVVVDGYNVTKSGYGGLALEAQRARLLSGLGALVARTGAEVTVVFDGAGRPPLSAPGRDPRGVRVAWSPPGVTADDVVLQFVAAEPEGRPVLVVSSDGEVVTGARLRGARPVASATLLARLDRS